MTHVNATALQPFSQSTHIGVAQLSASNLINRKHKVFDCRSFIHRANNSLTILQKLNQEWVVRVNFSRRPYSFFGGINDILSIWSEPSNV